MVQESLIWILKFTYAKFFAKALIEPNQTKKVVLLIFVLRTQFYRCTGTNNMNSLSCPSIAELNLGIAHWPFKKAPTFFHLIQYFITGGSSVCESI